MKAKIFDSCDRQLSMTHPGRETACVAEPCDNRTYPEASRGRARGPLRAVLTLAESGGYPSRAALSRCGCALPPKPRARSEAGRSEYPASTREPLPEGIDEAPVAVPDCLPLDSGVCRIEPFDSAAGTSTSLIAGRLLWGRRLIASHW